MPARKGVVNFNLDGLDSYDLVYLSLGAGLQSSVLYYMACLGIAGMPKVAYAGFADPGDEPQHTYDTLKKLIEFGKKHNGPPIHIISKDGEKLSESILNRRKRIASIPGFTIDSKGSVGMLRRQCTNEYKIEVLKSHSKRFIGVEKGCRMGSRKILCLQGITTDEATRMKAPVEQWNHVGYPLITMRMSRYDCSLWLDKNGFEQIEKSACVYCPYHNNHEWRKIKTVKKDWELACSVDKAIRNATKSGIKQPVFLHRDCKPLDEIDFSEDNNDLFSYECEGFCGL